jgi:lysophospholipid acyltransferase (LPLAT)-like uncharacterized protein
MSAEPSVPSPAAVLTSAPAPAAQVILGWKRALAGLAGGLMRIWCFTLRITLSEDSRRLLAGLGGPCLFVLWHNRLFAAADISRRFRPERPLHCLVSSSKDGAWLTAFFNSVGLRAVRGSSSRGGREAVSALVAVLRAGHDAGITPDGPRGPIYVCKPGAVVVARRAGVPILLVGMNYESAWRLRSWDKFYLPRPFSRVHLKLRELPMAALRAEDSPAALEAALRELNPDG